MIPRLGIQRVHLDVDEEGASQALKQAAVEPSAPSVLCSVRDPGGGLGLPPSWQQHSSYACQGAAAAHCTESGSSMEEAATGAAPQLQLRVQRSPSCEHRAAGALHHPDHDLPGGSSSAPGDDSQGSDSQSDDVQDDDDDEDDGDVAYGEPPSKKSSQKRRNKPPQPKAPPPGGILLLGPCNHCGVTFSPQWRKGTPDKPVLCNACGIRLRRHKSLDTTPASLAAAAAAAAAPGPPSHKRRSTDGSGKGRPHVVSKARPSGRPPAAAGSHSAAARSHAAAAAAAAVYSTPAAVHRALGDSEEEAGGGAARLSGGGGSSGADGGRTRRKVVTWNRLTHERTTASPSPGAVAGLPPGGLSAPLAGGGNGHSNKQAVARHTLQQLEAHSSQPVAAPGWGSGGGSAAGKQGGSSSARRATHRPALGAAADGAKSGAASRHAAAGGGAAWQSWGQGMAAGGGPAGPSAKHHTHARHVSGAPAAAAAAGGLAGHKRPSSALGAAGSREVRHPSQRSSAMGGRQQQQQQQQLTSGAGGVLGSSGGSGRSSSKGMWGLGMTSYGSHSNLLLTLDSPSRTLASSPLPGAGGHGPLGEDEDMCSLLQEWTQGGSLDDLAALGDPEDGGLLPPEEVTAGHAAALHHFAAGFSSHNSRGPVSNAATAAAAAAAMAMAAAAAGGVHSGEHQQAVGLLDHVLRQPMASAAGSSALAALSGSKAGYSGSNRSVLNSSWTSPSKALQAYNSSTLDARAVPWGGAGTGGGSSSSTSHAAEGAAPPSSSMAGGAGGVSRSSWLQKGIPLSSSATCIAALAEAAAGGLDPLGAPPPLPSPPLSLDLLDQGPWSGAPISPELLGTDALALEVFGQMGLLPGAPAVGSFPNLAASPDPLKALAIALHQEQHAGKQQQQREQQGGLPSQALEQQWEVEAGGEAGGSIGSNKPGGSSSASEQQGSPTANGSSAAQRAAAAAKEEGRGAAAAAGAADKLVGSGAAEGRQVARQLPMGEEGAKEGGFGTDAPAGVLSAAAHTLQQLLQQEEGLVGRGLNHPQQQQQQPGLSGGDGWVDDWSLYDSAPAAATFA